MLWYMATRALAPAVVTQVLDAVGQIATLTWWAIIILVAVDICQLIVESYHFVMLASCGPRELLVCVVRVILDKDASRLIRGSTHDVYGFRAKLLLLFLVIEIV